MTATRLQFRYLNCDFRSAQTVRCPRCEKYILRTESQTQTNGLALLIYVFLGSVGGARKTKDFSLG